LGINNGDREKAKERKERKEIKKPKGVYLMSPLWVKCLTLDGEKPKNPTNMQWKSTALQSSRKDSRDHKEGKKGVKSWGASNPKETPRERGRKYPWGISLKRNLQAEYSGGV